MTDDELIAAIETRLQLAADLVAYGRNGHLRAMDWPTRIKAEQAEAERNQLNRAVVDALRARGGSWRQWKVTADGLNYYDTAFAWRGRAAAV